MINIFLSGSGTGYFPSFPATAPYVTAVGATMGTNTVKGAVPPVGGTESGCMSNNDGEICVIFLFASSKRIRRVSVCWSLYPSDALCVITAEVVEQIKFLSYQFVSTSCCYFLAIASLRLALYIPSFRVSLYLCRRFFCRRGTDRCNHIRRWLLYLLPSGGNQTYIVHSHNHKWPSC